MAVGTVYFPAVLEDTLLNVLLCCFFLSHKATGLAWPRTGDCAGSLSSNVTSWGSLSVSSNSTGHFTNINTSQGIMVYHQQIQLDPLWYPIWNAAEIVLVTVQYTTHLGLKETRVHFISESCTCVMVWVGNVPRRLTYLNTWSTAWGGVWGGGESLLEEVHHWGWDLKAYRCSLLPVHSLCFVLSTEDEISQHPALVSMPAACLCNSLIMMDRHPSGTVRQIYF